MLLSSSLTMFFWWWQRRRWCLSLCCLLCGGSMGWIATDRIHFDYLNGYRLLWTFPSCLSLGLVVGLWARQTGPGDSGHDQVDFWKKSSCLKWLFLPRWKIWRMFEASEPRMSGVYAWLERSTRQQKANSNETTEESEFQLSKEILKTRSTKSQLCPGSTGDGFRAAARVPPKVTWQTCYDRKRCTSCTQTFLVSSRGAEKDCLNRCKKLSLAPSRWSHYVMFQYVSFISFNPNDWDVLSTDASCGSHLPGIARPRRSLWGRFHRRVRSTATTPTCWIVSKRPLTSTKRRMAGHRKLWWSSSSQPLIKMRSNLSPATQLFARDVCVSWERRLLWNS